MSHNCTRILVLLLLLAYSANSNSSELRVGFIERPPHIYSNADGTIKGSLSKRLHTLFQQAGVKAKLIPFDIEDINNLFSFKEVDAFITTKLIVDVPKDYFFSEKPVVTLKFYAYSLASVPKVNKLEDLRNTSIILPMSVDTIRGQTKDWLLDSKNGIEIVTDIGDLQQAIPKLLEGKAEYVISATGPSGSAMMFSRRLNNNSIKSSPIFTLPMYLTVRKSVGDSARMIDQVNRILSKRNN
jgi:hypothetical protein